MNTNEELVRRRLMAKPRFLRALAKRATLPPKRAPHAFLALATLGCASEADSSSPGQDFPGGLVLILGVMFVVMIVRSLRSKARESGATSSSYGGGGCAAHGADGADGSAEAGSDAGDAGGGGDGGGGCGGGD
ncbi:MAG TPA: hypothetical protein VGK73_01710 [Polyangiaceae bacterium]